MSTENRPAARIELQLGVCLKDAGGPKPGFLAGFNDPKRPVGVVLELGPTGTGKTTLIENLCDILYGDPQAYVRVNCADFSDSHQVNRFVGAPPSYVGYNDSKADHYFTQEQLDKHHTPDLKLTIVLLDEIEKAHQDFYQYLLAIFNDGKGRVDGKDVDFSRVLFVMTSNLGATDIQQSIGFSQSQLEQLNQVHPSWRTQNSSRARGRRCTTTPQPLYPAAGQLTSR